jgi:uncharacterized protein with FMN-binding domain
MAMTDARFMTVPPKARSRILATSFASLGLLSLAGCAVESATAHTGTAAYADGTYTTQASYQAPSGTESISVDLTVANDVVTSVNVSGNATDPEAAQFQARFASGISTEVVGKDLSSLSVTRVSGASLTSNGFNTALDDIRAQAG